MYIIAGLGNPGSEYENTRHNAGRIAVSCFVKENDFSDFVTSSKYQALISSGVISRKVNKKKIEEKVTILLPETFMNKSGASIKAILGGSSSTSTISPKKAEKLIVVQDDLDMPIGKIKIVFNRGSGGHKGVESIQRAIKNEAFARIKIGICPQTLTGKLKKPDGEKLLDFIVGEFKKEELAEIKKVAKKVSEALTVLIIEGRERAMNEFN